MLLKHSEKTVVFLVAAFIESFELHAFVIAN